MYLRSAWLLLLVRLWSYDLEWGLFCQFSIVAAKFNALRVEPAPSTSCERAAAQCAVRPRQEPQRSRFGGLGVKGLGVQGLGVRGG